MTPSTNAESEIKTERLSKLSRFSHNLAKPSDTVTDRAERRQVRFQAIITLVFASLMTVGVLVRIISGSFQDNLSLSFVNVLATLGLFVAHGLSRSRYYRLARLLAMTLLVSFIYVSFLLGEEYSDTSLLWLSPIVILAGTMLSLRNATIFAIVNILLLILFPFLVPGVSFALVGSALGLLIVISALILATRQYRDQLEAIREQDLTKANSGLRSLSQSLEDRVRERTHDLALAAEVGQIISQIRDLDDLLQQAVIQIRDRFDLYYTQIYLIDKKLDQQLVLRAGTGAVGQTLLAKKHSLPVSEQSINGRAAATKEAVIVADTENSDFFLPNPLLPDTRSEMAIPLIVQNDVVGVINLQSNEANGLSEDNLPTFTVLAGQLAVAINNARLLTEMERSTNFLDSVIENLPVMLFVKDAKELRFVRWNKAGAELTGYSKEEFLGKNDFDFFPEEEAEFFQRKDREVLAAGKLVDIPEEPIQTAHQGERLLHTFKVPIFDAHGNPEYLLGISEDITERKQMERDLEGRVKQLNLLNDIGRQANMIEEIPELLQWVCTRIPNAVRFPDECLVAITLEDELFGDPQAQELPRHIIEEMQIAGKTVGRIYIAYRNEAHNFVNEESALIGGIGQRLSSYIETRHLVEQLRIQAADLQKVTEISTAVATTQNPHILMQRVANLTQEYFNLYQTTVFLVEDDRLTLTAVSGAINQDAIEQGPLISLNSQKSIIAKAARNREGILVDDVLHEPDYLPHPLLGDARSELAIPLRAGDEIIGVIDFQSNEPNHFQEEEINIYSTLALQVAISWKNAQQHEQMQAALEELSALQRVITNESWESFMSNRERAIQGYLAAEHTVKAILTDIPESEDSEDDEAAASIHALEEDSTYIIPVKVRGTTIGKLGIRGNKETELSEENQALITAISQQVAEALERARLFEETELARTQTDQLYAGSERVVRATSLEEVLEALTESSELSKMESVNLLFFEQAWGKQKPETAIVSAVWSKEGTTPEILMPPGTHINISQMPTEFLNRSKAFIVMDAAQDQRLDEETRGFLLGNNVRSICFFPLVAAGEWIGMISGQSSQPVFFKEATIRQITSLVDQAATVAQTQRLFEEANARAQQEQILRQVSERVYGAVDAESVLRTAVKEVGQALGLEAFIYIDENNNGKTETNGTTNKPKAKSSKNS